MKLKIFVALALVSVFLMACSDNGNEESNAEVETVENIKEIVHDYSVGNLKSPSASVRSHELIVTNLDQSQIIYKLPEDEFLVSIAPFIETTHP